MKITFLGAAEEVTGSNMLIEVGKKKFLVDCGLIQGKESDEEKNYDPFLYNPADIDFMLLTHAHIDHSGRIPKLYKEGFRGKVYTTRATKELCQIMLSDSGYIQETEIEWKNRKRKRENKVLLEPIYIEKDAEECIQLFEEVPYNEIIEIDKNIRVRFIDAGHMLGSASIEVWGTENGVTSKAAFSGDVGNPGNVLLDDPESPNSADYLILESTYGNRIHGNPDKRAEDFLSIVTDTLKKGGNVIVPSFAVGRTQEIIYELNKIKDTTTSEEIKAKYEDLMKADVYVDSPLATNATKIFNDNLELLDEDIQEEIKEGVCPLEFPGLKFTSSVEESRNLNFIRKPKIIISASGMCEAGRIKHHLKHNLWNPENTIIFVGYQAPGTLGKSIIDGAKHVKIFGEDIAVNARIEYIEGFSGHSDQNGLLEYINNMKSKPKNIFLVHGEPESQIALKERIEEEFNIDVVIPRFGEVFDASEILTKLSPMKNSTLQRRRKQKLQAVYKISLFVDKIKTNADKLKDYTFADKILSFDPKIKSKESEYLEKLYDAVTLLGDELKEIIDINESKFNDEVIDEEEKRTTKFRLPKLIRVPKRYILSNKKVNNEEISEEDLKEENKKEVINAIIKIKGRKERRAQKEKEQAQRRNKAEKNLIPEVKIIPKDEEKKTSYIEKGSAINVSEKAIAKMERDKKLDIESSLEELMKQVEAADKKLKEEKEELEKLKNTKVTESSVVSPEEIEKKIREEISEIKNENSPQEENKKVEEIKEDIQEEVEELKKDEKKNTGNLIQEIAEDIAQVKENSTEEYIEKIFDKIAKIDNIEELDDDDIETLKNKIKELEDKIDE